MGTRGAFGVIIGEQEKIGYNQFDSYPSGNGIGNLQWLREVVQEGRLDEVAAQAKAARLVTDYDKPTRKDIKALADVSNDGVSTGDDWYALTHGTHGSIPAMLNYGYIWDSHEFPLESLFCEWGYIVDFDREVFEVYMGFQDKPHSDGRFADRRSKPKNWEPRYQGDKFWYPIRLIESYPFDALPSDEEFLAIEQREYARSS